MRAKEDNEGSCGRCGVDAVDPIPRHLWRFTGLSDKIVAMYARGMTTHEIQGFLAEPYGTEVSPESISAGTDA